MKAQNYGATDNYPAKVGGETDDQLQYYLNNDGTNSGSGKQKRTFGERMRRWSLVAVPLIAAAIIIVGAGYFFAVTILGSDNESSTRNYVEEGSSSKNGKNYEPAIIPMIQPETDLSGNSNNIDNSDESAACDLYPSCADLLGNCCPTNVGDYLGCCTADTTTNKNNNNSNNNVATSSSAAACKLFSDCANLLGNCCPTDHGDMLGCCHAPPVAAAATSSKVGDAIQTDSDAACALFPACADLIGNCCPTGSGDYLGCCNA